MITEELSGAKLHHWERTIPGLHARGDRLRRPVQQPAAASKARRPTPTFDASAELAAGVVRGPLRRGRDLALLAAFVRRREGTCGGTRHACHTSRLPTHATRYSCYPPPALTGSRKS